MLFTGNGVSGKTDSAAGAGLLSFGEIPVERPDPRTKDFSRDPAGLASAKTVAGVNSRSISARNPIGS